MKHEIPNSKILKSDYIKEGLKKSIILFSKRIAAFCYIC
jgi:hypothetical protein